MCSVPPEDPALMPRSHAPLAVPSDPPPEVLHLYGQPHDPAYLEAQQEFARAHPWFRVRRLDARTHFSMIEAPADVADAIEAFVAS